MQSSVFTRIDGWLTTNHSYLEWLLLRYSPPKDDPISVEDLKQYNGTDESKPVYVAVKGTVFDVSPKREMYGEFRCCVPASHPSYLPLFSMASQAC